MDPQRPDAPPRDSRLDRLPPTSNSWSAPLSSQRHDRANGGRPQEAPGHASVQIRQRPMVRRHPQPEMPRHGIVSGIIILPHFRPAPALLDWDKQSLRWPGPFDSGFLSPQPPGVVGIGPVRRVVYPRDWANESWSFFVLGRSFPARPRDQPRRGRPRPATAHREMTGINSAN